MGLGLTAVDRWLLCVLDSDKEGYPCDQVLCSVTPKFRKVIVVHMYTCMDTEHIWHNSVRH